LNRAVAGAAAAMLVIIGTLEARESARQLAELANVTRLQPAGAGLTALGVAASAAVYLVLGWWIGDDRGATRFGAGVGLVAGLVGGALRAWLIADAVRDAIGRYIVDPDVFATVVLVVFVALSMVVSALGGAALAFAGVRVSRLWRSRPPA
jgi:hypothetical protein